MHHQGTPIATHIRNYQLEGYTTDKNHLCSHHQHCLNCSAHYYLQIAQISVWIYTTSSNSSSSRNGILSNHNSQSIISARLVKNHGRSQHSRCFPRQTWLVHNSHGIEIKRLRKNGRIISRYSSLKAWKITGVSITGMEVSIAGICTTWER